MARHSDIHSKDLNPPKAGPWAPWLGAGLVIGACLFYALLAVRRCGGELIYALDDAYIHMAIAKNIVMHGVHGVSPFDISTCSSSPTWTLLLCAGYGLFGFWIGLPAILNLLFAGLYAGTVTRAAMCAGMGARAAVTTAMIASLLVPIPVLCLSGMEHTAHLALATVLVLALLRPSGREARPVWVVLLSALVMGLRYESLFILTPLFIALLCQRRVRPALALAAGALAALLLSGGVYYHLSGLPVPQSLLQKSPGLSLAPVSMAKSFVLSTIPKLTHNTGLHAWLGLLVGLAFYHARKPVLLARLVTVAAIILLHAQFSTMGWLFRYEAYLVGLAGALVAPALYEFYLQQKGAFSKARRAFFPLVLLVLLLPAVQRSAVAMNKGFRASGSIQDIPHRAAGVFKQACDPGDWVVINDLGCICLYNDLRVIDLYGLASPRVLQADGPEWVRSMIQQHKPRYILANNWLLSRRFTPPADYIPCAMWVAHENAVLGDDVVQVWARDPESAARITRALKTLVDKPRIELRFYFDPATLTPLPGITPFKM